MVYGYARVSTVGQATDGNSLEAQIHKLKEAGAEEIFSEHFTGTTTDRPEFKKLIAKLQPGDKLCVCKLDRFARTVSDGSTLIKQLNEKGVAVHILNLGVLDGSSIGKMMINIVLAFAEFERDMIVERCQEGKRVARTKNGFHEGRPRVPDNKTDNAVRMLETMTYKEVSEITGISVSTILRRKRELKAEEIKKLQDVPAAESVV